MPLRCALHKYIVDLLPNVVIQGTLEPPAEREVYLGEIFWRPPQ